MKKYIGIAFLFVFINKGWTQNTNLDFQYAIKLYNLTTYEEFNKTKRTNSSSSYYEYTSTNLQMAHPTIAIQRKTKKNNFHEIELTNLMISKSGTLTEIKNDTTGITFFVGGDEITTTYISMRYEFILNFNKAKNKKLVPSIGFGINPYFRQFIYTPKLSSSFGTSESYCGVKTFVTPRLTYYLTEKLFFDINIPVCFFDTYYLIERSYNPTIPADERKIKTFDYKQFPKTLSGRIGIGLKI